MRNVGSLGPWLWRPSLQKNVAGLELRLGAQPPPRGGAWAALPRSARTLLGGGSVGSRHPCSVVVMGSSQGGPNPSRLPHQTLSQAWIPLPGQTTCFCCCLVGEGNAEGAQKFTCYFSKLKNKFLFRGTWLHPHSSRLALQR